MCPYHILDSVSPMHGTYATMSCLRELSISYAGDFDIHAISWAQDLLYRRLTCPCHILDLTSPVQGAFNIQNRITVIIRVTWPTP